MRIHRQTTRILKNIPEAKDNQRLSTALLCGPSDVRTGRCVWSDDHWTVLHLLEEEVPVWSQGSDQCAERRLGSGK